MQIILDQGASASSTKEYERFRQTIAMIRVQLIFLPNFEIAIFGFLLV